MTSSCEICGTNRNLDRHHVIPRRMGGTKDPHVHDVTNLMTLCRQCHSNIHDERWRLARSDHGIRVIDRHNGEQVMRRHYNQDLDASSLFQLLNLASDDLSQLQEAFPYLVDDDLVDEPRH